MAKRAPKKAAKKPAAKKAAAKKPAGRPRKVEDPRLKFYKPEKGREDVILLDRLSVDCPDPIELLKDAAVFLGPGGIVYISDTAKRPTQPGPDVRRVENQNLQRWFDRSGLVMKSYASDDDMRIYAIAEKAPE